MNILFVSIGNQVDYQCDCLFHGLTCLENVNILNEYRYMFEGNSSDYLLQQYGMGFTITNRISLSEQHIHTLKEAEENIRSRFYDIVIYGSIFRCNTLLKIVFQYYDKNKIIFIDGEDEDFAIRCIPRRYLPQTRRTIKLPNIYIRKRYKAIELSQKGVYFKRELREKDRIYFLPISFAIPKENIVNELSSKQVFQATIIPGKRDTYIYTTEEDYYRGYQIAQYGITMKKGGWDCMRHYEILANSCIPYFPEINDCPSTTMVPFPKHLIVETNNLYKKNGALDREYEFYANCLLAYTKEFLTTEKLAQYVLSFI